MKNGSPVSNKRLCSEPKADNWWLRSPSLANTTNFYNVNTNGNINNNNASNANGLVPGFFTVAVTSKGVKTYGRMEKENITSQQ